jgi:pyrimidine operon attenuation protein/uracil phosphoribosyltransferase
MANWADEQRVGQLVGRLEGWLRQLLDGGDTDQRWALVGVRSRGDVLAKRLAAAVDHEALEPGVGVLDITLYRDDLTEVGPRPVVRTTEVPFAIDGLDVVLVDDVLMTGRSVRAALESLMDLGRPRRVWLMVLIDRGGRELPIQPDVAAATLEPRGHVQVRLVPTDDVDAVEVGDAVESGGEGAAA